MSTTPPDAPQGSEQRDERGGPGQPGEPGEPGQSGPRVTRDEAKDLARIRRSRHDRKVAGVAAGVARHLDVDPLLVRVGFVLLVVFGGAGILLYGACWLLVPEEDTEEAVIRVDDGTRTVILAIAGAISLVAVVGDSLGEWSFPWPLAVAGVVLAVVLAGKGRLPGSPASGPFPPPPGSYPPPGTPTGVHQPGAPVNPAPGTPYARYQPPPPPPKAVAPRKRGPLLFFFTIALAALLVGVVGTVDLAGADVPAAAYPATVLATCGVMLLVGAVYGRAGGLIFVGLVAALATAVTTVADDLSLGEVVRTPDTATELERSYELGVGRLAIDLRDLDLATLPEGGQELDLDLDVGQIEVIVPDTGLDVVARAETSWDGQVTLFDERSDSGGRLVATHDGGPDATTPQLTIDAHAGLGEIKIVTEGSSR